MAIGQHSPRTCASVQSLKQGWVFVARKWGGCGLRVRNCARSQAPGKPAGLGSREIRKLGAASHGLALLGPAFRRAWPGTTRVQKKPRPRPLLFYNWCRKQESNLRPTHYECARRVTLSHVGNKSQAKSPRLPRAHRHAPKQQKRRKEDLKPVQKHMPGCLRETKVSAM